MRFYVYALCDPLTEKPFYIGKGQGSRAYHHVKDVRRGRVSNEAKTARIQSLLDRGQEPLVRILEWFADERKALAREAALIAELPDLTNIALSDSPRSKAQEPKSLRGNLSYLKRWLAWVEKLPNGVTFPNLYQGDIIAHNFVISVRKLVAECEERQSNSHKLSPTESVTSWLTGPVSGPFASQTTCLP